MNCKICSNKTNIIFISKILGKYDVSYYRCNKCFFIQTEEPFWLDEAYSLGAIGALDVGIMSRNLMLVNRTEKILRTLFLNLKDLTGVDFGGGHGIFVRMMRDLGFNFYRQDMYAENLYARYFDVKDLPIDKKFNILTAFEVFEHLSNPLEEIKKMFDYADILLLSTELQPSSEISILEKWWYLVPEGGQHISFFNEITFLEIANIFEANYYTDHQSLHILSKKNLSSNPFLSDELNIKSKKNYLQRIVSKLNKKLNGVKSSPSSFYVKPDSLTMIDFKHVKQKIITNEY